jgi:hypothetical protein
MHTIEIAQRDNSATGILGQRGVIPVQSHY